MGDMIIVLLGTVFFSIPVYVLLKLTDCLYKGRNKIINLLTQDWVDVIYTILIFFMCIIGFKLTYDGVKAGNPLSVYEMGGQYLNGYASLSLDHMLTIVVFFILGMIAYYILKTDSYKLSPIVYIVCCSLLILNIVLAIVYYFHTKGVSSNNELCTGFAVLFLKLGFIYVGILYIAELKNSLDRFIEKQTALDREYKNKLLNMLYGLCMKYQTMPILWGISLFPVLIIIQFILVIFGQQPDSFIKVFLDTSSFNYSKVIPPKPIVVPGDGHYLCTVSAKGHKKLVRPLRSGIRGGHRILVNRQLLVANAFENILEEYTPKLHKRIRYIYDTYGYPLSKHIKTKWSADIIYLLMKPLECFFVLVIYTVDETPENRINIQYSDLRNNQKLE